MLDDLRYAVRTLFKTPMFVIVAVVSLGIAIAANTTVFSVINAIVLTPPAVDEPRSLVRIYTSDFSGPRFGVSSYPDFMDFRERGALLDIAASRAWSPLIAVNDSVERADVEAVTGNYFSLLGLQAAHGRTFVEDEAQAAGAGALIVLTEAYWQRRFGSDPAVIGKTIDLNSQPFTILGILPREFTGVGLGNMPDAWVPLSMLPGFNTQQRGNRSLRLIGRLKPDSTIERVRSEFAAVAAQLQEADPQAWTDLNNERRLVTVLSEAESRIPARDRAAVLGGLALMLSVMFLVLLMACANVASLQLARGVSRQREIAIRFSLGATRVRVLRHLLVESLLLTLAAGTLGLLLATWATTLLNATQNTLATPTAFEFAVDYRVIGFAFAAAMLAGIMFGVMPAVQSSKVSLAAVAKGDTPGGRWSRSRMRSAVVCLQIAVSFLLLIGAGLFLRSLGRATTIDPGFDTQNVLLFSTDFPAQNYPQPTAKVFQSDLLETLSNTPGVESATMTDRVPLTAGRQRRLVSIEGYTPQPGEDMEQHFATVGPDYFEVLRIPIVRGRGITASDREGLPGVAVVNETFARKFWPGQDPLGKRFRSGSATFVEVIGVAKDSKYSTLSEDAPPFFYLPALQTYLGTPAFMVRTQREPTSMIAAVRDRVRSLDSKLLVFQIRTLVDATSFSLLPPRAAGSILAITGFAALLLAAIGIYGVVAYSFQQRTQEIGVRMALGAQPGNIVRLVLRHGLTLAATGMGFGLAAALATTRLLSSFLYGISPTDPVSFIGTAAVLMIVAILASYFPARRMARIDPVTALRE